MKKFIILIVACIALASATRAQDEPIARPADPAIRFTHLDVFIDTGRAPLAAYQFEVKAQQAVKIVGVESGEAKGFQDPPYYDPAALQNSRIIIGAFNTSPDLPAGKVHAARLHLAIEGGVEPQYSAQLIVAGNAVGEKIPATITFAEGAMP